MTDQAVASARGGGVIRQDAFGRQYVDRFSNGSRASASSVSDAGASYERTRTANSISQRIRTFLNQRVPVPQSIANFLSHPLQSLVRATALPLVGGAGAFAPQSTFENVAQTIGKGAGYSPIASAFQGKIKQAIKSFASAAGTTLLTSEVIKNSFNYYTGRPQNWMPTRGEVAMSLGAGLTPFGHIVGAVSAGAFNLVKQIADITKSGAGHAAATMPDIKAAIDKAYNAGSDETWNARQYATQQAQSGFNIVMSLPTQIPSIPLALSVGGGLSMPSVGIGLGGLAALGIGAYALTHRKKKRKKYKRSKHKK